MNDSPQQADKRRTTRVKPATDAPVHIDLMGQGFVEVTTADNVSKDGIGISVPHGFEDYNLDELVVILVKLPEPINHSFSTSVRIIHQQGEKFGVQFDSLKPEDEEQLGKYIEHRLTNTDSTDVFKMIYGV